jgi:hypothetical protein
MQQATPTNPKQSAGFVEHVWTERAQSCLFCQL